VVGAKEAKSRQVRQVAAKTASSSQSCLPQEKPGQIFLLGDEIVLLHELTGSKGRVLTRHGHLKRVKLSDLKGPFSGSFSLSLSTDELKNSLVTLDDEVMIIEKDFSMADLWELLVSEGDEDYSAEDLSQMWLGSSSLQSELAVARLVKLHKVYFTERNLRYKACEEKKVLLALQQQRAEEERERQLERVLTWFRANFAILEGPVPDYIEPVIQSMKDSVINDSHVSSNSIGGRVLNSLNLSLEDGAFTLLVTLGIFSVDENLLLHQFNIRRSFSDECLEAAERIEQKINDNTVLFYDRFRENVDVPVFTIDDFDTMDRDDGLSFEKIDDGTLVIGVHITDVSAFIAKDSVLDKEAFKRASSVYLPDQKHPMLPEQLSGGSLSLLPGDRKRCVSVFITLTPGNEILESRCALTWVRVARGFTYNEVLESLEGAEVSITDAASSYDYHSVFKTFRNFADALFEKRMENGGVESDREFEMKVVVSEDSISTWKLPKKCPARTLIAEMAIVANTIIAGTLKEASIPCIYRTQLPAAIYESDSSSPVTLADSSGKGSQASFNKVITGTAHGPHATLGVDIYTQATSPVRRYSDLLVQRQLAAFLSGVEEEPIYTADELEFFLDGTAYIRDGIRLIEKWGVRYWILKYIYSRKSDIFPAVVIEKRREHIIVELVDFMIRGRLFPSAGSSYEKGTPLTVSISEFDPRKGFIRIKESCYS
jgi:exoribonuclease-2